MDPEADAVHGGSPRADLVRVARNSAVLLAGTFAAKAFVFVSYLVLTRRLGAEDFGRYTYLFVYLTFFELFADAGLEQIVVRESGRDPASAPRWLGDALLLRALLVAVAIPLSLLLFPWVKKDAGGAGILLLASTNLLLSHRRPSLRSLFEVPYRISLRMEIPILLTILSEAAALGLLVVLIPRYGLAGAVASLSVAQVPFALLLVAIAARRARPLIAPDLRRLGALLRTAAPLFGALLWNVVLVRADVLFLERMRGPAEVGIYSAPVRLVEVANLLPTLLMASVYPLMAASRAADPARIGRLSRACVRFILAILVPAAVIQIVYARPIVSLVFGESFAASARVLPLLAVSVLFVAAEVVLWFRLVAEGLEHPAHRLIFIAALVVVAAHCVLVPRWGAIGAAAAVLTAYAARAVAGLLTTATRAAYRDAVGSAAPALAAGLGSLLVLTATRGLGVWSPLAAASTYAALLFVLGGATREDLGLLAEIPSALRRGGPPAGSP